MDSAYYEYPVDRFINKIKNNDHFVISRFNDGEWYCMRREYRHNLEGHPLGFFSSSVANLTANIGNSKFKATAYKTAFPTQAIPDFIFIIYIRKKKNINRLNIKNIL